MNFNQYSTKRLREYTHAHIDEKLFNALKSRSARSELKMVLISEYPQKSDKVTNNATNNPVEQEAKDVEVYACVNGGRHSHFNTKERRIKSLLPGQYEEISMDWGIGDDCIDVLLNWRDAKGMEYTSSHSLPMY